MKPPRDAVGSRAEPSDVRRYVESVIDSYRAGAATYADLHLALSTAAEHHAERRHAALRALDALDASARHARSRRAQPIDRVCLERTCETEAFAAWRHALSRLTYTRALRAYEEMTR